VKNSLVCNHCRTLYSAADYDEKDNCEINSCMGILIYKKLEATTDIKLVDNERTRFVLVDHTKGGEGRIFDKRNISVKIDLQDEGRTLKVFLSDTK